MQYMLISVFPPSPPGSSQLPTLQTPCLIFLSLGNKQANKIKQTNQKKKKQSDETGREKKKRKA